MFPYQRTMYFCKYAKSKEKVLFYSYSSLFLEYRLKIQSIGVSNGLCCIFYLTVSSHLKYAYFYRRFQSFQSLFGSLFSLFSIAVWIYFNRLQTTAALELNYFLFETFYLLPFLASVSSSQGRLITAVLYSLSIYVLLEVIYKIRIVI